MKKIDLHSFPWVVADDRPNRFHLCCKSTTLSRAENTFEYGKCEPSYYVHLASDGTTVSSKMLFIWPFIQRAQSSAGDQISWTEKKFRVNWRKQSRLLQYAWERNGKLKKKKLGGKYQCDVVFCSSKSQNGTNEVLKSNCLFLSLFVLSFSFFLFFFSVVQVSLDFCT